MVGVAGGLVSPPRAAAGSSECGERRRQRPRERRRGTPFDFRADRLDGQLPFAEADVEGEVHQERIDVVHAISRSVPASPGPQARDEMRLRRDRKLRVPVEHDAKQR